jgi:benzoyl-CoA-dihydrodiol lyase
MTPDVLAARFAPKESPWKHNRLSTTRRTRSLRALALAFDGPVASLTLDVREDGGIRPGYKLKLNSYDSRRRHRAARRAAADPLRASRGARVVVTSGKERIFCSGANIFMLGLSSHAWKVNFCKFTNETRNGIEDASRHSGLKFVAACNGVTAGGGYELALACDEIVLVDDRSSAVSLPEVPLLGVLPGTGGLTRITDKRKVRHDLPTSSAPRAKACGGNAPGNGAWSTTSQSRSNSPST